MHNKRLLAARIRNCLHGRQRILGKLKTKFRTKKTSKTKGLWRCVNFGGPYEPVYEPFFTGFKEASFIKLLSKCISILIKD